MITQAQQPNLATSPRSLEALINCRLLLHMKQVFACAAWKDVRQNRFIHVSLADCSHTDSLIHWTLAVGSLVRFASTLCSKQSLLPDSEVRSRQRTHSLSLSLALALALALALSLLLSEILLALSLSLSLPLPVPLPSRSLPSVGPSHSSHAWASFLQRLSARLHGRLQALHHLQAACNLIATSTTNHGTAVFILLQITSTGPGPVLSSPQILLLCRPDTNEILAKSPISLLL